MKRPRSSSSSLLSKVQSDDDGFVDAAVVEEEAAEDEEVVVLSDQCAVVGVGGCGEKKRRLSAEQVRALERSFETDNKLEPERKARLARDLGLQPRQVAVWFQNRRARWKTKQLERDYVALRHSYDALRRDKDALVVEIKVLKAKLGDEDVAASFSSVKEEPVASDVEPPAAATAATAAAPGPSESDSSGVVNDAETGPVEKAAPTAEAEAEAVVPGAAASLHGEVFLHGQNLKLEDDEAAFLGGGDDYACGGFFADLQPPSLPWWTETSTENWA